MDDLSWYLHGDHEYYISVKAKNGAGLCTVGTSSVYRHIMQLPSKGVVLDVPPSGEDVIVDFGVCTSQSRGLGNMILFKWLKITILSYEKYIIFSFC